MIVTAGVVYPVPGGIHRDSYDSAVLHDVASAVAPVPAPSDVAPGSRIFVSWGGDGDAGDGTIRANRSSACSACAIAGDDYRDIRQREWAVGPVGVGSEVMRNF